MPTDIVPRSITDFATTDVVTTDFATTDVVTTDVATTYDVTTELSAAAKPI
jgi:hypothetical protein